ncbi:YbaB/EbfC family nucleoid-associated protein [Amycolatopsis alba]|uniref:ABC transporter substrate-binding protein n=1 Tax=Amycolatopsis alba DSM 44262 TaxID=1125972 RepID=A0A229RQF3_AMYAL|nr:YbaB/EbfC family nucleoid-associated protein [Amycolatopsis alba]OXM48701.1 ABC transporter substrate-binding protein [Amycolatopsis alba DSM 44262]
MSWNAEELTHRAVEIDAELARRRFPGRSHDGLALAVVTGQGRLVGLLLADHATGMPHPQLAGPAVVEAVHAARRAAAETGLTTMRAVFGEQDHRRRRSPEVREDEESFEEFDFLSEELR